MVEMPGEKTVWQTVLDQEEERIRQAVWLPEQGRLYVSLFERGEEVAVSRRYKDGEEAERFVKGIRMSEEWSEVDEAMGKVSAPTQETARKKVRRAVGVNGRGAEGTEKTPRTKGAAKAAATGWNGETQSKVVSKMPTEPGNNKVPAMSLNRPYAIEIYGAAHLLKALADRAESPAVKETFRRASLDLEALTR